MVNIVLRQGESIEEAIRRFKRECEKHGILQEIKKREYYKPPSVVRKEKNNEIKRKLKRRAAKSSNQKKRRTRPVKFKKHYTPHEGGYRAAPPVVPSSNIAPAVEENSNTSVKQ